MDNQLESAISRISDVIASLRCSEPSDDEPVTTSIINDAITTLMAAEREITEAYKVLFGAAATPRTPIEPDPVATQPTPPAPAPDRRTYIDLRFRFHGTPMQAQEFIDRIRFVNVDNVIGLNANPGQLQSADVVDTPPACQAWRDFVFPKGVGTSGWVTESVTCTRASDHTALHGAMHKGTFYSWGDQ